MGLFDAVRSLFGGEKRDADEESDASTTGGDASAASSGDTDTTPPDGTAESGQVVTAQDDAAVKRETAGRQDEDTGEEIEGETTSADDISEWTFDSETDHEETSEEVDDDEDESDDEPVSWDETGFEQLTTELVGDEDAGEEAADDDEDDPAELITEAEPDRESVETDDESAHEQAVDADGTATDTADETATDTDAESVDRTDSETHLPLEEGVEAEEDDTEGDVDVPEDSPRADFVSEAVDLAEFWGEYDLDFTVASLERVDELIEDQWDPERFEDAEFGGEGYDSEVFTEQVRAIGSYLGEVIVRTHGGEWIRQEEVGWTIDVPAGPSVPAAGATVTVFHIAQSALLGEASIAAKHDGVVNQLDLDERVGVEDAAATLQQAGGDRAPQSTDEDVVDRFRKGAEDLADRWPDYDLDFSTASLARLEELLDAELDDERFEDVELGDETDRDSLLLTAHAVGVGGYLAEVLRQEHDANWITDGRLVVLIETDDERHEIDPIEVAVDCIRGERSLVDVVPE